MYTNSNYHTMNATPAAPLAADANASGASLAKKKATKALMDHVPTFVDGVPPSELDDHFFVTVPEPEIEFVKNSSSSPSNNVAVPVTATEAGLAPSDSSRTKDADMDAAVNFDMQETAYDAFDEDLSNPLNYSLSPAPTTSYHLHDESDMVSLTEGSPSRMKADPAVTILPKIVDNTAIVKPEVPNVENKSYFYSTFVASRLAAFVKHVDFNPDDPAMAVFASEPTVPMDDYIRRIIKLTRLPEEGVLAALIYLERIVRAYPQLSVTTLNIHRLFLTAAMLASKMMLDIPYQNTFWARVSGTYSTAALNQMELELLPLLDFNLYVSDEEYSHYAAMAIKA